MTIIESLQDIGKGRVIDNGCNYELIALAKGVYTFTISNGEKIEITLTGRQGENAAQIEKEFYRQAKPMHHNAIIKAEYRKAGKR